ncbi:triose-phosphate isomerase [Amylibacter sp. IMCC11727]|uniref:triose-phosphate isomerase n=1 Tax=Amylibacter sp. IMCC11727 TaxID=3039851 RepID=UPI00244DB7B6|nr:triose-phosphate isomerase [Amylibacter sp. IMCC11727]WGI20675.1 triose-phosphate isomerase [Amylibacter sp. IMCC11727]
MPKKLAAGNWKMNGLREALAEVKALNDACPTHDCDVLICPPATLMRSMAKVCDDMQIDVGGQDCHENTSGAHTGDISAPMLADTGATYVILGHSERRATYGETDRQIRAKTTAAWNANLTAIVCIGETLEERDAANTLDIVGAQLATSVPDNATAATLVVAYEPVWAIGTGKTPTLSEIEEVHTFIRNRLTDRFGAEGAEMRILYGGSMNPKNAADIAAVPNVDGGLVGGASLKASDFIHIVQALNA